MAFLATLAAPMCATVSSNSSRAEKVYYAAGMADTQG